MILHDGRLLGYLGRTGQQLLTFPADPPTDAQHSATLLAQALAAAAQSEPILLNRIDSVAAHASPLAPLFQAAGFRTISRGLLCRGG